MSDKVDRFVGSLLGTAYGDVLGAAVEGMTVEAIRARYGEVRDFFPGRGGLGRYTDDTQMTLALARSMVLCSGVDAADCARSYAEHYEPRRGYGRSAHAVLAALREGADWRETGTMFFPDGSYGNGGAMRIAPVGLVYGDQPPEVLREKVLDAIRCTHVHPEAVDGALIQARAVGRMLGSTSGKIPDAGRLLDEFTFLCRTDVFRRKLGEVRGLLDGDAPDDEAGARLGTGVSSAEAVPAALFVLLRHGDDPEESLVRAVGLGGDTDTIAAMVGALCGALHGAQAFPRRWHEGLENGPEGRDAIIEAAERLARLRSWS